MAKHKSKGVQDKGQVKASAVVEPRRVKVAHDKILAESWLSKILLPIGFKYNEAEQSLRSGDIIVFLDGSEHYVWKTLRVPLNGAMTDAECWSIYRFGINRAIDIWKDRLRLSKQDPKIMSENECLVIYFLSEEVKYEQRRATKSDGINTI